MKHKEENFPNLPFVEFYEDEVTWSIKLKVPDGIEPGKKTLRCQAGYMVCNDKCCSPPGQWTFPDAELTVLPGGGAAKRRTRSPNGPQHRRSILRIVTGRAPRRRPPRRLNDHGHLRPARKPAAAPLQAQSEIAQKAEQGLIPFLIASAIGGLFALVMPCVWPMVPITVNFFVKQGQGEAGRAKTTGLAITYCLSIIGVFTAVGVLFSFFFSASALADPGE